MPHNFIYDVLFEFSIHFLDHIGASLRWLFSRKNSTYKEVYAKKYNGWLGFIISVMVFFLIFYLLNY